MDIEKLYIEEFHSKSREIDIKISAGLIPREVYKFRIWNDSPRDHIVKRRTIRLASPLELQADYPELRLPIDETIIDEAYMKRVARAEARKIYPFLNENDIERIAINEVRPKLTLDIKDEREWAYIKIREFSNAVNGVFCASYTFEDIIQWEYIANLGKGFAVSLDMKKVYLKREIFGTAGYVQYYPSNKIPTIKPYCFTEEERIERMFKQIFAVPDKFSYEKEYRIVRSSQRYDEEGNVAPFQESQRIITLNMEDYTGILLGYDMDAVEKDELIQVCKIQLQGIPIYQTKIEKGKVVIDYIV